MGSNDLLDSDELRGRIWRGTGARSARVALPTGFAALDRYLPGGGWPLGPLIEVFVERYGVGELSLLMPALAALTDGGGSRASSRKWVAWIAPPFVPYAPALQQRGVAVDALLLVHPSGKECLWTVEQVIRSGSTCGGWLGSRPPTTSRCGVCNWRQKLRVVGRFYSGRWPPVASGPLQLCVSVSSGKARSLECESTNVAAHGPPSSISEQSISERPGRSSS